MKLYYAKNNNSLFMCFQIPDVIEKENFLRVSLDLYLFFSHWGELCSKNCIVKRPKTLTFWSVFSYATGSY